VGCFIAIPGDAVLREYREVAVTGVPGEPTLAMGEANSQSLVEVPIFRGAEEMSPSYLGNDVVFIGEAEGVEGIENGFVGASPEGATPRENISSTECTSYLLKRASKSGFTAFLA
jgi:hypothetical protein